MKVPPTTFEGFDVKYEGGEVVLSKKSRMNKSKLAYTVKHTVDSEAPEELNPNAEQPEGGETKSKFEFKVDIIKDGITIGITCNYGQFNADDGGSFVIPEVAFYEGEWKDSKNAVACRDILDGLNSIYLQCDRFFDMLEERGISVEFARFLSDCSCGTGFEHKMYISFMENIKEFYSY